MILFGDYNVDLLEDSYDKDSFEACMQSNYLIPTILSPTRVETIIQNEQEVVTESLIDNIFINHNMKCLSGIIETSMGNMEDVRRAVLENLNVNNKMLGTSLASLTICDL